MPVPMPATDDQLRRLAAERVDRWINDTEHRLRTTWEPAQVLAQAFAGIPEQARSLPSKLDPPYERLRPDAIVINVVPVFCRGRVSRPTGGGCPKPWHPGCRNSRLTTRSFDARLSAVLAA